MWIHTSRKERVWGENRPYLTARGSCCVCRNVTIITCHANEVIFVLTLTVVTASGMLSPRKYELPRNISMCLCVKSPKTVCAFMCCNVIALYFAVVNKLIYGVLTHLVFSWVDISDPHLICQAREVVLWGAQQTGNLQIQDQNKILCKCPIFLRDSQFSHT